MEISKGVFVSSVATEQWEADREVGGEMHVLCETGNVEAGLSRFTIESGPICWTLPARETLMVLEGEARIELADGPTLELRAGDVASLPAGAVTTWHLKPPFREFWVLDRSESERGG